MNLIEIEDEIDLIFFFRLCIFDQGLIKTWSTVVGNVLTGLFGSNNFYIDYFLLKNNRSIVRFCFFRSLIETESILFNIGE